MVLVVRIVFAGGAAIAADMSLNDQMVNAARKGDLAALEKALDAGAKIDYQNKSQG